MKNNCHTEMIFPPELPLFTTWILIYLLPKNFTGALRRAQLIIDSLAFSLSVNGVRRGSPDSWHRMYEFSAILKNQKYQNNTNLDE